MTKQALTTTLATLSEVVRYGLNVASDCTARPARCFSAEFDGSYAECAWGKERLDCAGNSLASPLIITVTSHQVRSEKCNEGDESCV